MEDYWVAIKLNESFIPIKVTEKSKGYLNKLDIATDEKFSDYYSVREWIKKASGAAASLYAIKKSNIE